MSLTKETSGRFIGENFFLFANIIENVGKLEKIRSSFFQQYELMIPLILRIIYENSMPEDVGIEKLNQISTETTHWSSNETRRVHCESIVIANQAVSLSSKQRNRLR